MNPHSQDQEKLLLKPKIKNLFEKTGADEKEVKRLRKIRAMNAMRLLIVRTLIVERGGNIHQVDPVQKAKNRAANKVARRQRKVNRDRA